MVRSAPSSRAWDRFAPTRRALQRSAPRKSAPRRSAPVRSAPGNESPARSALARVSAGVRSRTASESRARISIMRLSRSGTAREREGRGRPSIRRPDRRSSPGAGSRGLPFTPRSPAPQPGALGITVRFELADRECDMAEQQAPSGPDLKQGIPASDVAGRRHARRPRRRRGGAARAPRRRVVRHRRDAARTTAARWPRACSSATRCAARGTTPASICAPAQPCGRPR